MAAVGINVAIVKATEGDWFAASTWHANFRGARGWDKACSGVGKVSPRKSPLLQKGPHSNPLPAGGARE